MRNLHRIWGPLALLLVAEGAARRGPFGSPRICFAGGPAARAEEEEDKGPPSSKPGAEPDGMCSACGMQNEDDAKFCDQCGKSMAAKKMDDEDEDPPSSKESPSSKDPGAKGGAHPPPPEKMQAPAKVSRTAKTSMVLEAAGDSPLQMQTAALKMRDERDLLLATLAGLTGKDDIAGMIGAAHNIPGKLSAGRKARRDLDALQAKANGAERWDLAFRLVGTGTIRRDKVLSDNITADGLRAADPATGKTVRLRTKYAAMDLGVLRGMVTDLEGDAPKKRRDPFEPDQTRAKEASRTVGKLDTKGRVEAMAKSPAAQRMFRDPNNARTMDQIAEALVRNEDTARGATAGGAP